LESFIKEYKIKKDTKAINLDDECKTKSVLIVHKISSEILNLEKKLPIPILLVLYLSKDYKKNNKKKEMKTENMSFEDFFLGKKIIPINKSNKRRIINR
jgi:hypothetical protein